jgi:hypothetical protein
MADIDPIITINVPLSDVILDKNDQETESVPPFDDPETENAFYSYRRSIQLNEDWPARLVEEKTDLLIDLCHRLAPELAKALVAQIPGSEQRVSITPTAVCLPRSFLREAFTLARDQLFQARLLPSYVGQSPESPAWGGTLPGLCLLISISCYAGNSPETFSKYVFACLFPVYCSAARNSTPQRQIGRFLEHLIAKDYRYLLGVAILIPNRDSCESYIRSATIDLLSRYSLTQTLEDEFINMLYDCLRSETRETDSYSEKVDDRAEPVTFVRYAALKALQKHPRPKEEIAPELMAFIDRNIDKNSWTDRTGSRTCSRTFLSASPPRTSMTSMSLPG